VSTAEAHPMEPMGDCDGDVTVETHTLVAPPVSQTKGRGANRWMRLNEESRSRIRTNMYKCKQNKDEEVIISGRTCNHCHLKDHYPTTCPLNLNRSHAVERRGSGRGSVRKRGRPRTRICSSEKTYDEMVDDTEENSRNGEDWFDVD
jgi:hypothetical protein